MIAFISLSITHEAILRPYRLEDGKFIKQGGWSDSPSNWLHRIIFVFECLYFAFLLGRLDISAIRILH